MRGKLNGLQALVSPKYANYIHCFGLVRRRYRNQILERKIITDKKTKKSLFCPSTSTRVTRARNNKDD